jgi:hypothetical protein
MSKLTGMSNDPHTPLLGDHKYADSLLTSAPNKALDTSSDKLSSAHAVPEPTSQLTNIISQESLPVSSGVSYNIPAHRAVVVHYWTEDVEANHFYHQFSIGRSTSISELIGMSLEYFVTVVSVSEDASLYELRFASKSGQPKDDLPGKD